MSSRKNINNKSAKSKKFKRIILLCSVVVMIIAVIIIIFVFCNNKEKPDSSSINEMVSYYSTTTEVSEPVYITSKELIVPDGNGKEVKYKLPKDEFYLALAPYYENTHPCKDHYLTKCKGELFEEEFFVTIVDQKGNKVIDEMMKSTIRGFIDIWLPRNGKFDVTVVHNSKIAEHTVSTSNTSKTCITEEMKLG